MPQLRGTIVGAYAFFFAFGQLAAAIALQVINTVSLCIISKLIIDLSLGIPISILFSIRFPWNMVTDPHPSP